MFKRKTLNGYLTIESMPTCFTYYASLAVGQKKDTVNECLDSACSLVSSHTVNPPPPHTHTHTKKKKSGTNWRVNKNYFEQKWTWESDLVFICALAVLLNFFVACKFHEESRAPLCSHMISNTGIRNVSWNFLLASNNRNFWKLEEVHTERRLVTAVKDFHHPHLSVCFQSAWTGLYHKVLIQ